MTLNIPKVVTITGGSGGFNLLRGLRDYPIDITAIVSVFDSGGSTGVLLDEYGALPQGDIRCCLLALLPESESDWRKLLEHRFEKNGASLSDHSLGNLMLLGAEKEWGRAEAVARLAKLMHARGRVLPVSTDSAHLQALLADGTIIETESAIDTRNILSWEQGIARVMLDRSATATRDVIEAIASADFIVIGPGDLYTSVIPNLLVNGVVGALNTTAAKIVFVVNIMTKGAETRGYSAADFVESLGAYGMTKDLHRVVVNSAAIPSELRDRYAAEHAEPVELGALAYRQGLVRADLLSRTGLKQDLIRHSSKRLGRVLMDIFEE